MTEKLERLIFFEEVFRQTGKFLDDLLNSFVKWLHELSEEDRRKLLEALKKEEKRR